MSELMSLLGDLGNYFHYLFVGIQRALLLDPTVFKFVDENRWSGLIVLGIVFLAGASTLLGQSAVLFINRVRKSRFVFSLVLNGIIFIVSYMVWGVIVWLIGSLLFKTDPSLLPFLRTVGLSTAPLIFGFFILIPWMGPFIGKVLNVWSLLIMLAIVRFNFGIGFWGAALCVGLGWLASLALNNTIGKPIVALRNRMWKRVTGSPLDASAQEILLQFSQEGAERFAEGAK